MLPAFAVKKRKSDKIEKKKLGCYFILFALFIQNLCKKHRLGYS